MLSIFLYGGLLLAIATYEDIKKREVYDFLTGLSILVPIIYGVLLLLNKKEFHPLAFLASMAFSFIIGSLLYYFGIWGFGDTKFFIAIGGYSALISPLINLPIHNNILKSLIITSTYLILSFIFGGILAIAILLFHYFRNYKKVSIKRSYKIGMGALLVLIILSTFYSLRITVLLTLLLLMTFMLAIAKEIEKISFIYLKDTHLLVPGDWIVEDIKLPNETIKAKECKTGLTEDQIKTIQKSGIKKVKVKDGIPFFIGFLPTFLLFFFFLF